MKYSVESMNESPEIFDYVVNLKIFLNDVLQDAVIEFDTVAGYVDVFTKVDVNDFLDLNGRALKDRLFGDVRVYSLVKE